MMRGYFLKTQIVSEDEFWAEFRKTGGIYFIRDEEADVIKIGYTRDPIKRLSNIQVGNGRRLRFIGLIAAEREIEAHIHAQLAEARASGEWFHDRGVTTEWLLSMTQDEPMCRHVWRLVKGRQVYWDWNEEIQRHTKHVWDEERGEWSPPLPKP